jgi:hypothetical protein
VLVDADQKDPFDFSPEEYNDQLVAGYSKNTRSHGLIVYMPDLSDLSRRSARATAEAPKAVNSRSSTSRELDVLAHGVPDGAVLLAR